MPKSKFVFVFVLTLINLIPLKYVAKANINELDNFISKLNKDEKFQYGMMLGSGATICELNALNLI